jgi:hypothetical protein
MATIAEKYWELTSTTQQEMELVEEEDDDYGSSDSPNSQGGANRSRGSSGHSTSRDTRALELRKLVSEDDTVVGALFRGIGNRSGSESTRPQPQLSRRRQRVSRQQHQQHQHQQHSLVRFRDETWQDLYGFLHGVVCDSQGLDDPRKAKEDEEATEAKGLQQQEQEQSCDKTTVVYDKETLALVMGLVFGKTTTTPCLQAALVTALVRQKLETIARACSISIARSRGLSTANVSDNDLSIQEEHQEQRQQRYALSKSRCYLLSLRLADEGLWAAASDIMQSRSSSGTEWKTDESESSSSSITNSNSNTKSSDNESLLLSIDGMIFTSTFLIDRLYSQTYVRQDVEDTEELAIAIHLGRKAVAMAEKRYDAMRAAATAFSKLETSTSSLLQVNNEASHDHQHHLSPQSPPPMESLFANDTLRYLYAKLALGRALSLLAQHVGLMATDTHTLRIQHKILTILFLPTAAADEDEPHKANRRYIEPYPAFENFEWTESFFEESRKELRDGLVVCDEEEQQTRRPDEGSNTVSILALRGALTSADAERSYCAATASYRMRRHDRLRHQILSSISTFLKAFRTMMEGVLDETVNDNEKDDSSQRSCAWVDTIVDTLLRCGKDLGKTCGFADRVGVDYTGAWNNSNHEGRPRHINPKLFLVFAHLVSMYRYGSFHPTTKNIEQLLDQREIDSSTSAIAPKYLAMVTWLVAEYGGNH